MTGSDSLPKQERSARNLTSAATIAVSPVPKYEESAAVAMWAPLAIRYNQCGRSSRRGASDLAVLTQPGYHGHPRERRANSRRDGPCRQGPVGPALAGPASSVTAVGAEVSRA